MERYALFSKVFFSLISSCVRRDENIENATMVVVT